jgi:hypothetical protein
MKKFLVAFLVLASMAVNAAEVVVLEAELPVINRAGALVDTRFYMDLKTGEGFVKAAVSEQRYTDFPGNTWCSYDQWGRCIPNQRPFPTPIQVLVFSDTVKVEGLMLMGDQAVYTGAEGNVICGTIKPSRILKVPTLYLSGNCDLDGKIVKNGNNSKLVVTLKTK